MHIFPKAPLPAFFVLAAVLVSVPILAEAQQNRPASPRGSAATQLGGSFDQSGAYQGGYWIDVDYGRPILRARDGIFGSGDSYGEGLLRGAPLWRVGADQSTRLRTEVDLVWEGGRLPAGEYSVFAELGENEWTLVFADWGVKQTFEEDTPNALWGAYGYTPERDALRTPMRVATHSVSADQLVVTFTDVSQEGGNLTVWWDDQIATAAFTIDP